MPRQNLEVIGLSTEPFCVQLLPFFGSFSKQNNVFSPITVLFTLHANQSNRGIIAQFKI